MLESTTHILLFYLFSALALISAIAVVTTRHILRAAVYLMGTLAMGAGFYVLLDAPFLAGIQVLVYIGGIVVLLVFAVMLTRSSDLLEDTPSLRRRILGFGAAVAIFVFTTLLLIQTDFPILSGGLPPSDDTAELGRRLLDPGPQGYVLPFELISLLLLAAVIGGIVLARKVPTKNL